MFKFKKFKVLAAMAVVFMIVIAATPSTLKRQVWNAIQYFKQGIYIGTTNQTYFNKDGSASLADGNLVYNTTGQITTAAGEAPTDYVNLPIATHTASGGLVNTTTNGVFSSSRPVASGPVIELQNGVPVLVWNHFQPGEIVVHDEASSKRKAIVTFRVPANYSSTPVLTLFASSENSATLTTPKVDYEIFINGDGDTEDVAAFDNEPIALAGVASTPDEVILTIATVDIAAIASGKWLTVKYWRSQLQESTYKLRSRGLVFSYVKKH